MANKPSTKKRLVKNPETFRERALKAAAQSELPSKASQARASLGRPVKRAWSPIGRMFAIVFGLAPFRLLGKVLRVIGRIVFPRYFRSSVRELRQVKWPGWRQSRQLTYAVLAFAVVFGALVAIVDYGLDKLFKEVLLK